MKIHVITIFPSMLVGFLHESMIKRAVDKGAVSIESIQLRDFTDDVHRTTDDRPFGGGPGMVLQVQPVVDCVEHVQKLETTPGQVILLTPQGKPLDQPLVEKLADQPRQILLCGRSRGLTSVSLTCWIPWKSPLGTISSTGEKWRPWS